MGYGQFGGTGSVNWKVAHEEDGQKKEGKGKDNNAAATDGDFTVVVNGVVVARVPIDRFNSQQILVIWPPDALDKIPRTAKLA